MEMLDSRTEVKYRVYFSYASSHALAFQRTGGIGELREYPVCGCVVSRDLLAARVSDQPIVDHSITTFLIRKVKLL